MSGTKIRLATLSDLDAVEALENAVFEGDRLSRRSLRYYIESPTAAFLALDQADRLAGDAIVAFRKGSVIGRLYSIAIRADQAGRGLGRQLLAACEDEVRSRRRTILRLEVRSDNAAAIALYERAGYQRFGTYPDYYEDGASALRYQKAIGPDGGGDAGLAADASP